jgi:hypothetical protein
VESLFQTGCQARFVVDNSTLRQAVSEALKPIEDRTAAPGISTLPSNGFDLGDSCAFHLQVDGGVLVRRVLTGVTKPLANGRQINSRFQESNCGAVSKAVRM